MPVNRAARKGLGKMEFENHRAPRSWRGSCLDALSGSSDQTTAGHTDVGSVLCLKEDTTVHHWV